MSDAGEHMNGIEKDSDSNSGSDESDYEDDMDAISIWSSDIDSVNSPNWSLGPGESECSCENDSGDTQDEADAAEAGFDNEDAAWEVVDEDEGDSVDEDEGDSVFGDEGDSVDEDEGDSVFEDEGDSVDEDEGDSVDEDEGESGDDGAAEGEREDEDAAEGEGEDAAEGEGADEDAADDEGDDGSHDEEDVDVDDGESVAEDGDDVDGGEEAVGGADGDENAEEDADDDDDSQWEDVSDGDGEAGAGDDETDPLITVKFTVRMAMKLKPKIGMQERMRNQIVTSKFDFNVTERLSTFEKGFSHNRVAELCARVDLVRHNIRAMRLTICSLCRTPRFFDNV